MRFLLDACVLADAARPGLSADLEGWLRGQRTLDLVISAVTMGELRHSAERLPAGRPRSDLVTWLETGLPAQFAGRILPLDQRVAERWGVLRAAAEGIGRPLPTIDGVLLATAQAHALTFVTRHDRDVSGRGVGVITPY